jgi:phosphoribosyl 1,2-cyclic phosphodiesterase
VTEVAVRFWGVRGSIACAGPQTSRYGGDTSCIEVRCGDHLVILAGGTGLRRLGDAMAKMTEAVEADLFFSHFHFDHICGLPFFAPCYQPASRLRLWAGGACGKPRVESALAAMMADPLFPTGLDAFTAAVEYRDFQRGDTLRPQPGILMRTAPLNHPGGATGYRLEYRNRAIAYITDTEHRLGERDPNVLRLADAADLMIYDCTYCDEEFPAHAGWGHSTWQEGIRLAETAGAKMLAIFHHDPSHDDDHLDRIAAAAAARRPGTLVATDGMFLPL